ncbi:insulinoma-associated protein 1a [Eurytemora carolleeae]|uniref:insulinoma-associated protein 1a n=1 Tax=Eurytemora carolleeae TaxID=1294199 RepID=UPI000C75D4D7|nr:insulinoma-associated protein 1a [Eurytemora carolleeae]|eukprot:XP_023336913.1 insulinoma-associated protein 1a-like [Eurytemora affinis]
MQTEELRESFPVAKKPVKDNQNTDVHKCVLCETVLSSKLDLQEHFRKHGNGSIDSKGRPVTNKTPPPNPVSSTVKSKNVTTVHCDVCTAQFETVTQAIHHKYKQHPNSQLNHFCKFCGKQFPLEVCKDMHIRAEHSTTQKSNKIYKCRLCSVDFYSAKAVQAHVQSSHK